MAKMQFLPLAGALCRQQFVGVVVGLQDIKSLVEHNGEGWKCTVFEIFFCFVMYYVCAIGYKYYVLICNVCACACHVNDSKYTGHAHLRERVCSEVLSQSLPDDAGGLTTLSR